MGKSSGHDESSDSSNRKQKFTLQITNGRSSKKVRAANSPSPSKTYGSGNRDIVETDVDKTEDGNIDDDSVVELSPTSDSVVPGRSNSREAAGNETFKRTGKSEKMLDKISERASKFLPSKGSIGKFFHGENKEAAESPGIYTIDKEMGRTNMAFQGDRQMTSPTRAYASPTRDSPTDEVAEIETFQRSELTDRLRKARQHPPGATNPVNPSGKNVGVQASDYPPYRLMFVPSEDFKDPDTPIITITRVLMCQCSVACFLLLWIIFGALVFYLTEGPYESDKIAEFNRKQKDVIFALATDLRLIAPENNTDWVATITKYTEIHAAVVTDAVVNSYGSQQPYWTFPGSLMFCVSLLTTLGLAAPLPMTTGGQVGAFIFTLLGFPLHVFFLMNLGRSIAVKTQIFAKHVENQFLDLQQRIINVRRFGEDLPRDGTEIWPEKMFLVDFKPPPWLCWFPLVSSLFYYTLGVLIFGVARGMPFPRIVLFFVDFSSTSGATNGMTRIGYTWYLEGAAILTAVNAIVYADSPFEGLAPSGIKLGFMTNSLD